VGYKLLDKGVYSGASLDEEDDLAGPLELRYEFFNRVCALDLGP